MDIEVQTLPRLDLNGKFEYTIATYDSVERVFLKVLRIPGLSGKIRVTFTCHGHSCGRSKISKSVFCAKGDCERYRRALKLARPLHFSSAFVRPRA